MQAPRHRDVQAIGQEGDEDVRLDAGLEPVKDRPDREIALEVLERLLDRNQQLIMAPQLGRVFLDEFGAQQIRAFARAGLPQLVAIEAIPECGAVCGDLALPPCLRTKDAGPALDSSRVRPMSS